MGAPCQRGHRGFLLQGGLLSPTLVAKACVSRPLLLQVLQKDKMAEAYSEIGLKGEVRAALGPQVGPGDGEAPRELLLLFQIHLL